MAPAREEEAAAPQVATGEEAAAAGPWLRRRGERRGAEQPYPIWGWQERRRGGLGFDKNYKGRGGFRKSTLQQVPRGIPRWQRVLRWQVLDCQ